MQPARLPRALVAAGLLFAMAWPALAASPTPPGGPTPAVSPEETPDFRPGDAWLDAALPKDAAAGSELTIGAFLWSGGGDAVTHITPVFRLHPAQGTAKPTTGNGIPDWAGHYVARVKVPVGGVGRLEIGFPTVFCSDTACFDQEFLFTIHDAGPPVNVPLPAITTATLMLASPTIESRQRMVMDILVEPNVDWPGPALAMPDQLIVQVRVRQGPIVTEVPATRPRPGVAEYRAQVSLIEPGLYVAQLAIAPSATGSELFTTALAAIEVTAPAATPTPPTGSEAGGLPEWWPLAAGGAGLILAAFLILRGRNSEDRDRD